MENEHSKNNPELEAQRQAVTSFYDNAAETYDAEFEGKAEYQVPRILKFTYEKHGITSGEILDLGCGTGKIKEYLGENFTCSGIDLSQAMLQEAEKRGVRGHVGPVEEVIKTFADKSVDHITALSSLYFIQDFESLIAEFERVARQSLFLTLEQFTDEIIETMQKRGIQLYNHSAEHINAPTEVLKYLYLWKRPSTGEKVMGDVVFKKM